MESMTKCRFNSLAATVGLPSSCPAVTVVLVSCPAVMAAQQPSSLVVMAVPRLSCPAMMVARLLLASAWLVATAHQLSCRPEDSVALPSSSLLAALVHLLLVLC